VAYGLGFRDAAYFSRFFRRMSGETPGAFRKVAAASPANAPGSFAAWP
jgi:AraC family transcriptional activator of pobA